MQLLKVIFLLVVLVAVIEAQKGGTKRPRPQNVPSSPSGRKTPQPKPRPAPQRPQEDDSGSAGNAIEENNEGESGPEPPAVVPQTSFTCGDKPYQPGMYADMEVDCSVYHMCFDGRKESFLCGTGTMFNQEILSCDHPGKVNCANSPQFYEANTELGKPGAEPAAGDSGSKGGSVAPTRQQPAPQPRPRVQQPSKTSPQKPRPQPAPQPQPRPAPQPFADDEPDDEPEAPAPAPAPVPQPRPRVQQPSKTSPQKPRPQPRPQQPAPRKTPVQPRKPIVQSYDDNEEESNVRRAYRARY